MKKKNIILITIISFISIMSILILNFTLFSKKEDPVKEVPKVEEKIEEEVLTTIILTINPKVALEIDKNGNIVNVYPLNDDAKIFKQEDFEGLNIEKGIEKVVDVAEDYLDKKPEITIASTEGEVKEINNIESIFNSKGIKTKKIELEETEEKEINEQIKEEKENRDKDKNKTTTTVTTSSKTTKQKTTKKPELKTTKKKNEKMTTTTTTTTKLNSTKKTTKIITTEKKSNNNYLKLLNVNKVDISFSKDIYNYEGIVNYDVSVVNINANAEDNNARVEGIGKKDLVVGDNNIVVKVIAEDESVRVYTIKITRRAMINLNDNKTYSYFWGTFSDEYLYPTNPECINKFPSEINIPVGQTYDDYCENKVPSNYPEVSGMGYYCRVVEPYAKENGLTPGSFYECHILKEIYHHNEMQSKIDSIVKIDNYFGVAGGYGNDPVDIKLDEEKCKKFYLSCGRW